MPINWDIGSLVLLLVVVCLVQFAGFGIWLLLAYTHLADIRYLKKAVETIQTNDLPHLEKRIGELASEWRDEFKELRDYVNTQVSGLQDTIINRLSGLPK